MPFLTCPSCGYLIVDASKPCSSCGAVLPLPPSAAQLEPGYLISGEYDDYAAREEAPKKTGAAALILAVVLLAAGAFYFFRPGASQAPVSAIAGKWQGDHGDLVVSYEFRPDNTVMRDMMMPNTIAKLLWSKGTYQTDGDGFTMTFENSASETGKFRISGDTLTMIMDGGGVQRLERAP